MAMRAVVNLPAAATARGAFAYALGLGERGELNFSETRTGAVGVFGCHGFVPIQIAFFAF